MSSPGFPTSFGIFQDYYTTHKAISGDLSFVGVIGTTLTACLELVLLFSYSDMSCFC